MPKPSLILMHGALGSAIQFQPWLPVLENDFEVHVLEFEGHGMRPSPGDRPFRMEFFADNLDEYIAQNKIENPMVFGYSMGGYASLLLAMNRPGLLGRVFTFATKFDWSPLSAAGEIKMLNPHKIREKVPDYARVLEERHPAMGWESVLEKTADMMLQLGQHPLIEPANLKTISTPVRLGIGDRDTMVGLEETLQVFRATPQAELFVMPRTAHPLEKIRPEGIAASIREFFLS